MAVFDSGNIKLGFNIAIGLAAFGLLLMLIQRTVKV